MENDFNTIINNILWDRPPSDLQQAVPEGDVQVGSWDGYLNSEYLTHAQWFLPQPYEPQPTSLRGVYGTFQNPTYDVAQTPVYNGQLYTVSGGLGPVDYDNVKPPTGSPPLPQYYSGPPVQATYPHDLSPFAGDISAMGLNEEAGILHSNPPEIPRHALTSYPTVPQHPIYLPISSSQTPSPHLSQELVNTGNVYNFARDVSPYGGYYMPEGPPTDRNLAYSAFPVPSPSYYGSSPSSSSSDFENVTLPQMPLQKQRQYRSSPYTVPKNSNGGQRQSGKAPSVSVPPQEFFKQHYPFLLKYYLNAESKAPREWLLKTCQETTDGKWACSLPGCDGQPSRTRSSAEYHARQHIRNRCFKCDSCNYRAYQKSDATPHKKHKCKSANSNQPSTDSPALT